MPKPFFVLELQSSITTPFATFRTANLSEEQARAVYSKMETSVLIEGDGILTMFKDGEIVEATVL